MTEAPDANPYAAPSETGTLPQADQSPSPASRGKRLLAFIIDGLLVGILAMLISNLLHVGLGWNFGIFVVFTLVDTRSIEPRLLMNVLYIVAYGLVNGVLLSRRGQTIGKYATSIAIVGLDGARLPLGKILMNRVLPFWMINNLPFISFIILVDILFIFAPGRRCLHDRLAGTEVVTYVDKPPQDQESASATQS